MEDVEIITRYFGAWAWHLTAIIFLCTMTIIIVLGNIPIAIGLGILMGFCEYKAISRQWELNHESY